MALPLFYWKQEKQTVMKKWFLLSALSFGLLFAACGDDDKDTPETAQLSLTATATYGESPLLMFERDYGYEDNMALQLQLFQTYLSDMALLYEEDGQVKEVPLEDIALLNFGNMYNDEDARAGLEVFNLDVPARSYTGIRFGLGVSPELNATIPPDYDLSHPLSQNYWEDANSYIFFKIEGNADLDGSGDFADKLTFHIGGDNNYSDVTFQGMIDLLPGGEVGLTLNFDLQKLLINEDGDYVDFRQTKQAHSNTAPAAVFIGNNMPSAVSLTQ